MTKDPVCGMDVEEKPSGPRAEHEGRSYYFCSEACRKRFEESPGDYVPPSGNASEVY